MLSQVTDAFDGTKPIYETKPNGAAPWLFARHEPGL
jgi:hypothetical protein